MRTKMNRFWSSSNSWSWSNLRKRIRECLHLKSQLMSGLSGRPSKRQLTFNRDNLQFLNQFAAFRKPFGEQTMTIDFNQLKLSEFVAHPDGWFLSQSFAQGCFSSAWRTAQQNQSIQSNQCRVHLALGSNHCRFHVAQSVDFQVTFIEQTIPKTIILFRR